ncbi:hypothetical protein hmeg3_23045 [Herbaspirillum sp. meg3]|jgi:hypothetical protein|uniref:hypothetical protein n=1 Tax=Herbaspirillum sp. meg3 TaxID=2025949 RepID=UPI000B97CCB8|nr:hypothetical protein [Herbaspirillum sp. meg3]ASU40895.1 hypothetical protein hmeg3_23045 [Herbaspirillum sp. meg3]
MRSFRLIVLICALALLAACSPKYNWREAHGDKVQFTVLLPAKPASFSRQIDLNGIAVAMTMTAAEIDDVTFAVGAAELADAAQAPQALASMRTALINNIGGTARATPIPGKTEGAQALDVVATGVARGRPMVLMARLIAKDKRIYQVLIVGEEKAVTPENIETFFTSFKPA